MLDLGAILTQTIKGEEKVIAFASRALADPEKKYSITEQECLYGLLYGRYRSFDHT